MNNSRVRLGVLAGAALAVVSNAQATVIDLGTTSLSNGTQSGSAGFSYDTETGQMTVVMTNTMDSVGNGAVSWMTGVFFELSGATIDISSASSSDTAQHLDNGVLSSATESADPDHWWGMTSLVDGWSEHIGVDGTARLIGGEDFSSLFGPGTQNYSMQAAGFGIPNDGMSLDGTNLDGSDGALLSGMLPDLPGGHDGQDFLIGSLTYMFDLNGVDLGTLGISNVAIVFGTDLEQGLVLVPLPPALALGVLGLAGIAVVRRRLG